MFESNRLNPGQSQGSARNILSISSLNSMAKNILMRELGQVWLSGEISNFVAASSGHWYFSLKDNKAQVKGAMFKGANSRVSKTPQNGDKIIVRASVSLYEPRGDYQIIVEYMEQDGEGLLKQQFEALKNKLMQEGLFATQTKQALPEHIRRVGVVTSATGAALHDILTVLEQRNPAIEVIVYPSQVQGAPATAQIVRALHIANQRNEVDVLIVGRGGGSLEDLWCFNEEAVARAIFGSRLPIVSAVGHEVDITIADFVADVRAATPSQAAELVSQDTQRLFDALNQYERRLRQGVQQLQSNAQHRIEQLTAKLIQNHPKYSLQQQAQHLDQLTMRLQKEMAAHLNQSVNRVTHAQQTLMRCNPKHRIDLQQSHLHNLTTRLKQAQINTMSNAQTELKRLAGLLNSVSPLATLSRGYSITKHGNEIIVAPSQVRSGDEITTQLKQGEIRSIVR
ncbi:exodeoxyribonuclease VII large subunit [Alteromonas sp. LMIT006]|jgi:exodeoxyribonuclease VII large subunit|uniref:exodeoxyribonuclease VII large subunit n=1 Tax=Alteromonadaceae TaxID=72275 RepID=UPI0020CA4BD2|nr:exodeoxyribonuclease VII large subunit [Alteromonas sp. LMIT006]UTP71633.1 exodeoxyribonuclease VII large subunit [Alteromonas sp. LMIT006]